MRNARPVAVSLALGLLLWGVARPSAQLPLSPTSRTGRTATPVFEGWYRNADGTFSISFGYFNRNTEEVLDVPIGADNFIEPGERNQGQPTHFQPGRHWGVFAVTVPADFGEKTVIWTLKVRGETVAIPGHLRSNWQIDALEGEAGSGNTPPRLKFEEAGAEGAGPLGVIGRPLTATAGTPLSVVVWARDDGKSSGSVASAGRAAVPVTLTWFKHQGPVGAGTVTFTPPTARVPVEGGSATTRVTFSQPGEYRLRVRANDASGVSGAGHAQCCWTNGFVTVNVSR